MVVSIDSLAMQDPSFLNVSRDILWAINPPPLTTFVDLMSLPDIFASISIRTTYRTLRYPFACPWTIGLPNGLTRYLRPLAKIDSIYKGIRCSGLLGPCCSWPRHYWSMILLMASLDSFVSYEGPVVPECISSYFMGYQPAHANKVRRPHAEPGYIVEGIID